jgi:hypothetical protein
VIAESPTAPHHSRALAHAHHRRRMDEPVLLQRMSPELAGSVEKVLSTEAAKNNLTQTKIYNRLSLAS